MMKNILSIILIAFCFWSCGDDKGESGDTGSIYGVITVASTAEPMKATGVELYHYGSLLLKTVTYDDGHYEFTDLEAGDYKLKVVATGYDEVTFDVIVEVGRTARADMQLTEAEIYMSVRTLDITDIVMNKATLNGSYSYVYSNTFPSEYGFYYATHSNPIREGTRITGTQTKNYSFSASVNDLKKGTYYVQAYAKNSRGVAYGEERTFQISGTPVITTLPATNIKENTAVLNAKIEYAGDPAYTERGFVYSSSFQNPTVDDLSEVTMQKNVAGTSTEFSANIAELTKNVTYYVRAYVTNANGTVYGESVSFKCVNVLDYAVILQESGIMVQKNDISAGADWSTANQLCNASTIANFSDWRLPTIGELRTLYDNRTSIGGFGSYYYWSSGYDSYYRQYYYLNFSSGKDGSTNSSSNFHVRCVRSLN